MRRTLVRGFLLFFVLLAAPAWAKAPSDPLARAARRAVASVREELRSAEALHGRGLRTIEADLRSGASSADTAFAAFASSVALVASRADAAATAAAEDFLAAAVEDGGELGTPGEGGAGDSLVSGLRRELDSARVRTERRSRAFLGRFEKIVGGPTRATVSLPPWDFEMPGVADAGGVFRIGDEPLRVRAVCVARFSDGRLFAGVAGRAPTSLDHAFDVRLASRAGGGPLGTIVGAKLDDGGVGVATDGAWSAFSQVGGPPLEGGARAGNHAVLLGVEPYDNGVLVQPGRLVRAATILVP